MNFPRFLTDINAIPAGENNAPAPSRRKFLVGSSALATAALALGCTTDFKMIQEIQASATEPVTFTPENVTYGRYYADADGESHFGEVDVPLVPVELPVGPPVNISAFTPTSQVYFLHIPAGYSHDWLTVGARMLWFHVAGEMEVTVSDGETRIFPAGTVVLAEDTTGKGHRARVVSENDVLLVGVELSE